MRFDWKIIFWKNTKRNNCYLVGFFSTLLHFFFAFLIFLVKCWKAVVQQQTSQTLSRSCYSPCCVAHGVVLAVLGPDIKIVLIVSTFLQFFFVPVMGQNLSFWLQWDYICGKSCTARVAWEERLMCRTPPCTNSVEETSRTSHFIGLHSAKNKTPIWDFYRA